MLGRLAAAADLVNDVVAGSFGPFGSGCLVAATREKREVHEQTNGGGGGPNQRQNNQGFLPAAEPTDRAVLSTAGRTILNAVRSNCGNEVACMIMRAALEHSATTGDGACVAKLYRIY